MTIWAVKMGVPVLLQHTAGQRAVFNPEALLSPRRAGLEKAQVIKGKKGSNFSDGKIPTVEEMTRKVLEVYQRCMALKRKK